MWITLSTLAALLVSTAGAARADDLVASGDDRAVGAELNATACAPTATWARRGACDF